MANEHVNKEALADGISAIVKFFGEFQTQILNNPDVTLADIQQLRDSWLSQPFFEKGSPNRREANQAYIYEVFNEIEARFLDLQRYSQLTDEELFVEFFAENPPPGLEVIKTPIHVHFRIPNSELYTELIVKSLTDQYGRQGKVTSSVSENEKLRISKTQGISIDMLPASGSTQFTKGQVVVTLENTRVSKNQKETFEHEFMHVLFNLLTHLKGKNDPFMLQYESSNFEYSLYARENQNITEEQLTSAAVKFLFKQSLFLEYRTQNEMLAYYVTNTSWPHIEAYLVGSAQRLPYYNYLKEFRNSDQYHYLSEHYNALAKNNTFNDLVVETLSFPKYQSDRAKYVATFKMFAEQLEARGYNKTEIAVVAALLPIRSWNRIF